MNTGECGMCRARDRNQCPTHCPDPRWTRMAPMPGAPPWTVPCFDCGTPLTNRGARRCAACQTAHENPGIADAILDQLGAKP